MMTYVLKRPNFEDFDGDEADFDEVWKNHKKEEEAQYDGPDPHDLPEHEEPYREWCKQQAVNWNAPFGVFQVGKYIKAFASSNALYLRNFYVEKYKKRDN